jgi:hypothetical protein
MDRPLVNLNLTNIRLLVSLDEDSVPKTEVNVPGEPLINVPEAHPG